MLNDREYLGLTIPFMLSTMTQPLMGAVNTAVMGHLENPKYIAAVALGAILFNNLYWLFGFLRVSTTGYAAQAHGAQDKLLATEAFFKPLTVALLVSAFCLVLQEPLVNFYLKFIAPDAEVAHLCRQYYYILIWGAPLVLGNYVALGWLMGQTYVRAAVMMQISTNVLNMALSIFFVFYLHMTIVGVAWATLLSQLYGAVVSVFLMLKLGDFDYAELDWGKLLHWRGFVEMLKVNLNLMIRTVCLLAVNNIIASVGASMGTVVLAANAVLLQIKDIISYLIDGMANGAAIFSGRAVGSKDVGLLNKAISITYKYLIIFFTLIIPAYYLGKDYVIALFTDSSEVIAIASSLNVYMLAFPLCAGFGLVLYGVFCGATKTAPIRNMMLMSFAAFYLAQYILVGLYQNHGLWQSILLFYFTQSVILSIFLKRLKGELEAAQDGFVTVRQK